jgi:5'-methylthioadenosine phosphorylase
MWAIIGGSGFEAFEDFEIIERPSIETPFGKTSSGFAKIKLAGQEGLFIPRHGSHHEMMPTEVNYRANIFALKKMGATRVLSISAIGSLKKEFKPGDMVVPDQYIDRTKGVRNPSFCGDGFVGHVSLAKPVHADVIEFAKNLKSKLDFPMHLKATYVCVEGPYFSTQAESKNFIQMGANIIGMTNFPEYALAREAGLAYFPACFVTDYDCWDDEIPHVTLEGVMEIMRQNKSKAFQLAKLVFTEGQALLPKGVPDLGLKYAVFTPAEAIPAQKREWLSVLQA